MEQLTPPNRRLKQAMSTDSRSIIVTAGASGIGRAIVDAFQTQGDAVHAVDIDAEAVARLPSQIIGTTADVADEAAVAAFVRDHVERFGTVDVLVNCAGIAGPTGAIEEISLDDWRRCLAVNLDAMFLVTRSCVGHMKDAGRGNIINLSSTAGWHGYPLRTPYAASKWAVLGLTRSLAMELGPYGIRCNAICPGSVNGERMDRVIAAEAHKKGVEPEKVRDDYTRSASLRTFIEPEDIAQMALFLASSAASKVTGQTLNVDGHLESFSGL